MSTRLPCPARRDESASHVQGCGHERSARCDSDLSAVISETAWSVGSQPNEAARSDGADKATGERVASAVPSTYAVWLYSTRRALHECYVR